jgi:hypothetical protein
MTHMHKSIAFAALIALALGAIILAPRAGAREQDAPEEGPIGIEKCQTISRPGSYKLVNNLNFTGPAGGTCLPITADFVTIDLAGFTISRRISIFPRTTAIAAGDNTTGIAVRNGSISIFDVGVDLGGNGSIVEGLRLAHCTELGIAAEGIVKGNAVVAITGPGPFTGVGISATGTVTGNSARGTRFIGLQIGPGSTVIGNTVTDGSDGYGIFVDCPANVTDNTAVNNSSINLRLDGTGCNNTNNVAP